MLMKRYIFILSGLLISISILAQKNEVNMLVKSKSQFSVDETVKRIEANLKEKEIQVFALFDHGQNAKDSGMELLPNQVIVFGSPKVGTLLMLQNPEVSIELPLKISVWQDKEGHVWTAFISMKSIADRYDLGDSPIVTNIQNLLASIVEQATTEKR